MNVCIIQIFCIDYFIGCCFNQWWFCQEDSVLFFYNNVFIGYGRDIGIVGSIGFYYNGNLGNIFG